MSDKGLIKQISIAINQDEYQKLKEFEFRFPDISRRVIFNIGVDAITDKYNEDTEK